MTGEPGAGGNLAPPESASTEMADAVAAVVLLVPGVAGLHPGAFGEAATHLPGRTVRGVQLRSGSTTVHVVLEWGAQAQTIAERVREAVAALTHGSVDVVVADVATPGETTKARES